MANTTNLNLKKPSLDDDALIADINDNMDKVDAAVQAGSEAIAIVSLGNTHGAIAAGQYVYVRGHSSLAEGLYTANSAIAANATLSSSNVTAVSGGAFNALNSNIAKMGQPAAASSTYSSLDNFKSGLISIVSGMNNGEVRKIRFSFSVTSVAPFKGYTWTCEITRGNASYFAGIAYTYGTDVNAVEIKYSNGTWAIEELAAKSDIEINDYSSQVTATGSYYNSIMLKKAGNVKMLVLTIFAGNTVIPANVDTVIATIPAACRPLNGIGSVYSNIDGHLFNLMIGSNGDITISQPVANNKINGRYVITYI